MIVKGPCQGDAPSSARAVLIRELTPAEVDEVSGGVLPLIVVAAVVVAVAIQEIAEANAENEESEGDEAED